MINDINKIKEGVLNGSIPSTFADSAATSNVGTMKDRNKLAFVMTERPSYKVFFACQMERSKQQQQQTNYIMNSNHHCKMSTLYHQSNMIRY